MRRTLPVSYTHLDVYKRQLFFDENLDYARRLAAAGVPVDLHSYAGAIHAFNAIPTAAISQRFTAGLLAAAAAMTAPTAG